MNALATRLVIRAEFGGVGEATERCFLSLRWDGDGGEGRRRMILSGLVSDGGFNRSV